MSRYGKTRRRALEQARAEHEGPDITPAPVAAGRCDGCKPGSRRKQTPLVEGYNIDPHMQSPMYPALRLCRPCAMKLALKIIELETGL